MTREEKARAYDEALKDMRAIYPNLKGDAKLAVEHAFPELRESEDERIINQLITLVNSTGEVLLIPTNKEELIAWLEKHKESLHISETCKENADSFTDEQKEQKPVDTSDFKTKLAEYLQNNSPKDGKYVISSESILEMAKEELIKRGVVQKPAEWSEEDEKMRNALWNLLKIQYAQDYSMTGVGIEAGKFRNWLKSLRP